MIRQGVRAVVALVFTSSVVLSTARPAQAAIPVIDGSNLAQNILSAVRTLQSNVNEATMIANELRNLATLPFSMLDQFRKQYTELFTKIGEIRGLIENYKDLEKNFGDKFPDFLKSSTLISGDTISKGLETWLKENRETMLGVAKTGAQVLKDLPSVHSNVNRLVGESQRSVGILQATQAGNQINAQIVGSLTSLNAQLASYTQAHMAYMMKQNEQEEAAKNRADHILDGYDPGTPHRVPMNPF